MKLQSINPHDQSVVGELEISTKQAVGKAVASARKALDSWRYVPVEDKANYIHKFGELLNKNKEKLARLVTLEMGKPLQQALDDVDWEAEFIDFYANNANKFLSDETVREDKEGTYRMTYEPYGVCACIAPWNFPLSMANSGLSPALLAGNTVVFKPSEHCTLSQKLIVELFWETGLPDGVLNLVIGDGEVGRYLVDSQIDLVWFTGSTRVGQEIYRKCGEKFIKSILEMGGSSPGIVFKDADLGLTMDNLYWARFLNCGQVCTSIKRLFVEKPVYETIVSAFVDKIKTLKVGNPLENSDIGPLVSVKQLNTLIDQVKDATDKGANVEVGGKQPRSPELARGNYFEPTILTGVNFGMRVLAEEVFGPVLPIIPFNTEEEVIELANKTDYGLSAEIYTKDVEKAERVAKQINAGSVAINTDSFFKPECPFGGYKKSGVGREYGRVGMQEFSQIKTITVAK